MKKEILFALTFGLAACGGGGSSSGGSAPQSSDTGGAGDEKNIPADATEPTAELAALIEGVYSAEVDGDEAYYYLDAKGVFHGYDYMNDSVDSHGNCYQSPAEGKVNAEVDNKQFYWRESENRFVTLVYDTELSFRLDGSNEIHEIRLGNLSSSSSMKINTTINGEQARLMLNVDKVSSPSIEDIQSAICD